MEGVSVSQARLSYDKVGRAVNENHARQNGWCGARDAHSLNKVLPQISTDDLIVDFGCCGRPWVTTYLEDSGYNVIGIDVSKPRWKEHSLNSSLGIDLIEYDGHNVPLSDDCASLVLMFGVLEHVGVWKGPEEKYTDPNKHITAHRQEVLKEVSRILEPDGCLLITKFPNIHGIDKLYLPDGGHLNSERTTENGLRELLSDSFEVKSISKRGIVPHRLPFDAPTDAAASYFTRFDQWASCLPIANRFAQSYSAIAHL